MDSLSLWLSFKQVWLLKGAHRLREAGGSLYKHVRDVLAKIDLTVGCDGLELHQFQVLWG